MIDAKVTTTDAAGNSTSATDTEGYSVDTGAPSVVVNIVDSALNVADKVSNVTFTFSEAPVGFSADDLTVSGGTISNLVQSASDPKVWTATFTATDDYTGTASVTVNEGSYTNAAGNPGNAGSDTVAVDTAAPVASITLDTNITPDDVLNAAESKQDIAVTGTVGGDVKVGDTVTLSVNGKTYTGLVQTGNTFSIKVPGTELAADSDKVIDAKVTTTDAAGNSTSATDTEGYSVQTTLPVASIVLDSIAKDGVINAAEAASDILLSGRVDGDAKEGDTVTLTINGKSFTGIVFANKEFMISVPGTDLLADGDKVVDASVTTKDAAGNSATATTTQAYTVDTTPPTIDITTIAGESQSPLTSDANGYALISATDKASGFTVSGVSSEADGRIVTVQVYEGTTLKASLSGATVAAGGSWSVTVPANATWITQGTVYSFKATVSDAAGNVAVDTDTTQATDLALPPTLAAATAIVSEEGLSNGLKDTLGVTDTTDAVTAVGTMAVTNATSVVFDTLGQPSTIGGTKVAWSGAGTGSLTAYADANGNGVVDAGEVKVLSASIDNTGAYTVTLNAPVAHLVSGNTTATAEDVVSVNLKVKADDNSALTPSASANLMVRIEDDSPAQSAAVMIQGSPPAQQTNLVLTMDISGSMGAFDDPNSRGYKVMHAAMDLIKMYQNLGQTKVLISTFGDGGLTLGTFTGSYTYGSYLGEPIEKPIFNAAQWLTPQEALTALASFTTYTGEGTNYNAGLSATTNSLNSLSGSISGGKMVSFFMTDGDVPDYYQLTPETKTAWSNVVDAKNIDAYAVAVETGYLSWLGTDNLNHIAMDGRVEPVSTGRDYLDVTDVNSLSNTLLQLATPPVAGDLLLDNTLFQSIGLMGAGADGIGNITRLVVDGVTYIYDHLTDSSSVTGTSRGTFDNTSNQWTVNLLSGAKLTVDMDNGAYKHEFGTASSDSFSFSIRDKDGDFGSTNYTLSKSGVTINGTASAETLIGSISADTILANAGNDVLAGKGGHDTLTGGLGADRFVFDTVLNASNNIDTITDFVVGTDKLVLDDSIFAAFAGQTTLNSTSFVSAANNPTASTAAGTILYNSTTGALSYDADGSGSAFAAVQFATMGSSTHPLLSYTDFIIL